MDQIQHCLAGRRFALMGFERSEEESIITALATARGIGHVVGGEPGIPRLRGLHHFSRFDASFINASANGAPEQPAPIEMITGSRKPALIVGSFEDLIKQSPGLADINREFVMRPYQPEDLVLRALRVLGFAESAVAIEAPMRNGARRIVVADDDATTIVLVSTILKHFNFVCEVARRAKKAARIESE